MWNCWGTLLVLPGPLHSCAEDFLGRWRNQGKGFPGPRSGSSPVARDHPAILDRDRHFDIAGNEKMSSSGRGKSKRLFNSDQKI